MLICSGHLDEVSYHLWNVDLVEQELSHEFSKDDDIILVVEKMLDVDDFQLNFKINLAVYFNSGKIDSGPANLETSAMFDSFVLYSLVFDSFIIDLILLINADSQICVKDSGV